MPHRDDLEAAHARIAALERELAAARKQGRAPLRCATCRGSFRPEDLDRTSGRLTCRNCRAAIETSHPPRPPRDLQIDDTPDSLSIRWDWEPSLRGFFATLIFGGITLLALVRGREPTGLQIFVLVTLGSLALLFAYLFVQSVVNHTLIRVDSGQLSIESGPLALTGGRLVLKATDIDQLYVVMLSGRHSVWWPVASPASWWEASTRSSAPSTSSGLSSTGWGSPTGRSTGRCRAAHRRRQDRVRPPVADRVAGHPGRRCHRARRGSAGLPVARQLL